MAEAKLLGYDSWSAWNNVRFQHIPLIPTKIKHVNVCTQGKDAHADYKVSQNYPNMQFFAIFATALKPLMLWFPKFSELLIRSQS